MKLMEIQKLLDATVLTGEDLLDQPRSNDHGSDLISDVYPLRKNAHFS